MLVLLIPFPFTVMTQLDCLSFHRWITLVTPDSLEAVLSPLQTGIQPHGTRAMYNFTILTRHHSTQPPRHNVAIMLQCHDSIKPSPIAYLSTVILLVNRLTRTKSPTLNQIHIEIATWILVSSPELKIADSPTIRDTTETVNTKTHSISRP